VRGRVEPSLAGVKEEKVSQRWVHKGANLNEKPLKDVNRGPAEKKKKKKKRGNGPSVKKGIRGKILP